MKHTRSKPDVIQKRGFTTPGAVEGKPHRGFTLLLAVLISSVLVALGSAIFEIVTKEVTLSSAGRESQFAFYAADTGIECALYWDRQQDAFATTSPQTTITCGGGPAVDLTRTFTNLGQPTEVAVTEFSFPVGDTAITAPCASVTVTRTDNPIRTVVVSSGYNTCDTGSRVRLERAIRAVY